MPSQSTLPILKRDTNSGLVVRLILFVALMVVAGAIAVGVNFLLGNATPLKAILVVFLIVMVPMGVGMVVSEVPRGTDWLFFRFGVATICRTGLPLLIVLVVVQSLGVNFIEDVIGYLTFFYVTGFLASVWISLARFKVPGSLDEVNRAVV